MNKINEIFNLSLQTGFIDKTIISDENFHPELLVNQKNPPKKVLLTLLKEFENCEEFYISVAFVTTSGVATIINKLIELEKRNIKGQILVSQYLNFSQPEALKRLLQFKNIDLRIVTTGNAHSKGYIFKKNSHYNLIVGSSNLTAQALTTNKEWNIKVSALDNSGIVEKLLSEFHSDFEKATLVNEEFIFSYKEIYQKQFLLNKNNNLEILTENQEIITPNSMQKEALGNLTKLREEKKNKALIISATGTGKTFLSAFDAKVFNPKKLLFVVHRLTIAKNSLKTFRKVFGNNKTMGLYSGDKRELDCDFVFSTIQTISKFIHLENFTKDHFDYIIIDETHRSGADSYLRLLNYFEPKFLLGMTATPERTDGNDIFQLFDHNIAYEIRLNRAMEEDMLSSFHYYGVSDLVIDNKEIEKKSDFNLLISSERVNRIIEQANFYGSDNGITRGLIFCSKVNEAIELSTLFNLKGFKTISLTGDSSEEERSKAIEKLESDNLNEKLDYIFTVDIFNEGIDIPKINQIIMLRPTESAIIFIQQLGRGLRKVDGKSYLTIIDFIGNYENNYLIPIALYGDTSYNKDSLRKLVSEGSRMIPGSSTINFDEITKEKIFKSIDSANMQLFRDLKEDYNLLKFKLGKIPMMMDFIEHGSRDPFLYVNYSNSFYNFITKVEKEHEFKLTKEQINLLELFSKEINNAKRIEESYILNQLILKGKLSLSEFKNGIFKLYGFTPSKASIDSCLININFLFIRKNEKIIFIKDDSFLFCEEFIENLKNDDFRSFLMDSINYSITTFENLFNRDYYKNGLILYNKYSRKDVCRLLNWDKDISSTVYGYRTNGGITPCFVTYHKSDDIDSTINYNDHFINPSTFAWESRSNRKLDSDEIKNVINSERILLFVKKEDGEGTDFYFMGNATIIPDSIEQSYMPDSKLPVVHFKFHLEQPIIDSVYKYITTSKKTITIEPVIHIENEEPQSENIASSNNLIPFYDFYAAAGSFSEMQSEKDFILIEVPENLKSRSDYFACKIVGESMNRVIPNGSICLFKPDSGGSRNGKIVLVENIDIQDTDFNSAFTIKTYSSVKEINEEGSKNTLIILRPNSYDSKYKDIVINEENGSGMRVVGEFVSIIK
jgi:superfamily II DNA or RNA helicase/HKD family nuclease/phage repressor protein C with HTH and peptisase S24 domain